MPVCVLAQRDGGYNQKGKTQKLLVQLEHLTLEDGLPTNVVNCGIHGKEGFIWLGTREGLVRYDGKVFKTFTRKNGLLSNNVTRIAQVDEEWLWVLCGNNSFDNNLGGEFLLFNTNTYECIPLKQAFPRVDVPSFKDVRLYQDTALILYSKASRFYTYSRHTGLRALPIICDTDNNFLPSEDGKVWVSQIDTIERGDFKIFHFDFNGKINYDVDLKGLSKSPFFMVGFTQNGRPIGTVHFTENDKQVLASFEENGTMVPLTSNIKNPQHTDNLYRFCGANIQLEGQPAVLFRPRGQGVHLLRQGELPLQLLSQQESAEIPIGNLRRKVFTSGPQTIWWCTSEGLFKLSLRHDRFTKYFNAGVLGKAESIRGILADTEWDICASSDQQGVVCQLRKRLSHRIGSEQAMFLMKQNDNFYFNREGVVFEYQREQNILTEHKVWDIGDLWSAFVDAKGNWWYGGGKGVRKANGWNGEQEDFTEKLFAQIEGQAITLQIFEADERIWFVTSKGLFFYDAKTDKTGRVDSDFLADIHHVHLAGQTWWISTNGHGLIRWDKKRSSFKKYSTEDGLSSNTLYACLGDEFGNLWVSSNYGLMQIDTATFAITTYSEEDGLPHHEFNRVSWHKDESGHLYFGGLNGLVKVKPKDFLDTRDGYAAPLRISSFSQYDEASQRLLDLTADVRTHKKIVLKPENGFFTLNVKLLDYKSDRKQYSYRFEGLQEKWTFLEDDVLQIGDLPFGNYLLKLKGRNQRGEWSSSQLSLEVAVLRPFYLTWWFITLAAIVLLASIFAFVKWRTWRLKQESTRLQHTVDQQTEELQKSVAQKDVLLREIHHRVKNNLQIISSLLNLERTAGHDEKTLALIQEARHRIKSMALIHKNLYQHDDLSNILIKDYFKELMSGLSSSYGRRKRGVTYTIESEIEALEVDTAIPIGIIATEVVTNAYKYAFEEADDGLIKLDFKETDNGYNLVISDNGPGLPDAFLSLESKSLGLRLIKLLIGQLKGTVRVDNSEGTAFIFEFPK